MIRYTQHVLCWNETFLSCPLQVQKLEGWVLGNQSVFMVDPRQLKVAKCVVFCGASDVVIHGFMSILIYKMSLIINHSQVEVSIGDALLRCSHKILDTSVKTLFLNFGVGLVQLTWSQSRVQLLCIGECSKRIALFSQDIKVLVELKHRLLHLLGHFVKIDSVFEHFLLQFESLSQTNEVVYVEGLLLIRG